MKLLLLTLAALLLLSQLTPGSTRKCWNLRGKCRQKCFRKERVYVYCTNNKMCCVKPKYQPKHLPWKV
ncbi:beta-defensin 123 [Neophocaena asiaeorientalis asiaeorientalis]|uniref:Beta-defensin n=2 Tax=Phocoenidae TaxID=9740 RepID=A0A341BAV8_NEOAA|nr:beta-defensin 123 [Neophocaena asiaeorientalis asiaeorientalis]XP_032462816.1 beta-defensin 36-like [Phocoena sinus]